MPYKHRSPTQFTRNETIKRLQTAKSYLGNKERLTFMRTKSVYLPAGYDPEADESFYAAPKLSTFDVECLCDSTKSFVGHNWKVDSRFMASNACEFVDWAFGKGASIGETIVIIFYPWKEKVKTAKVSTLWLGTWHHAPLIAWTGGDPSVIKVDFLSEYIDLIH